LCQDLFRAVASLHANASHNIGNDFLDLGGGNSRSRSARSSLVSLISIDRTLSRTCFSLLALGIAMTLDWRSTHASAIWEGVASWRFATFLSVAFSSNPRP